MKKSSTSGSQSKIETALKESEQRYRTTMMSVGDGVISTDIEGKVEMMNPVAEELTGWKQEKALGKSLEEIFHIINEETRLPVENPVRRVMHEGIVVGLANHTMLIAKDGTERPIADSGSPIHNENGDITGVVLVFRNQSQEREAQKVLQESEQKFHEAVEYLDQGYYSVSTDGLLIDHNQAYNRILGIDINQELNGQKTPDFWQDPEDRKQYLNELMTHGFIRNFQAKAKKITGEKIVVLMNSHLVKDENDKPLRIEGTVTDFTGMKLMEEALKESEAKYKKLFDNAQVGMYRSRIDGSAMLDVNKKFGEILGLTREESLGKAGRILWADPEDRNKMMKLLKEQGGILYNYEARLLAKNGEIKDVLASIELKPEEGSLDGTFVDITDRKQAEKVIEDNEKRFRELIESLPQLFWTCRVDGPCDYLSRQWVDYTGIPESEQLGYRWLEQLHPEDKDRTVLEWMEKVKTGSSFDIEFRIKRNDGVFHWFKTTAVPMHDAEGNILKWFGSNTDIDKIKKAEEQLRKLNHIYSLLSDINQAIVRTRVLDELFKQVCKIAVEQGGFGMAWIGLIDESSQKLKVIAQAGKFDNYFENIDISLNSDPLNYCPVDSTLRHGKHNICNIIANKEMAPCQKIAWEHGFRSSASFPLKVFDILRGALTFYSDEPEFFDEKELKLLDELAMDISFAMEYAEKETERKKTEEALRESREKYYYLYEYSPVGMYHTKIDGSGIIEINNSACEMLGFKKEELIGQPSAIRWADPNRRTEILKIMGEHGVATNFDADVLKKDGTILSCLLSMKIYKEEGYIEGFIVNITDRKLAEESLKTSEERFRTASESLTDVVYDWDIKEKVDWYGDIDGIMGYPPGEFPRTIKGWAATIHPEDKDRVMEALDGHLKGAAPYLVDYRVGRKDGEWRWWSARGTALRNDRGEPYKMIGSITDITERKLADETLHKSEARYKTLVENIPQKIFMKDKDYRWMSVNENFACDLGISPEDIVGKLDHDLFSKELADKYHADDVRIITTGKTEELEEKYVVEGKETWVNTIKTPVRDDKGEIVGLLGIFWDITGRKLAEEEIRKLNAELEDRVAIRTSQLEATNKELEAFSYSVSHDLRAPLRHVSGYVELLNKRFQSDLPEKGRHYLDSISDSVHVMGMLIDDLLQFSRSGRMEMRQSDLDMNDIVKEVKESLSKDNPDRKIEWVLGDLPFVIGDEAMLRLVWINLLSNAVKFTRPRKKARIEIGFSKEKKDLVFFVRDNGVGFDMQYAQKLFGVFQRLHPTEEFEGTGIGLANVQRIVLRHGGRTWAEAESDKGAVFYFSIPNK